ncbi:NirD/YgiW/YdeI family stress tolerance protein, partial [Acinetobacter pecorum]
ISAKTPVVITGEIDIDYKPAKRVEIDVEQVRF